MALSLDLRFDSSPSIPFLCWVNEPENKHRFRYTTDHGSHGVISGKKGKKTFPTVQLQNYKGSSKDIIIRVSLCTENGNDHVHLFKQKNSTEYKSYIDSTLNDELCAVFEDLSVIIRGNKTYGHESLMKRKTEGLSDSEKEKYKKEHIEEVKKEYKEILHSVKLKFVALKKENVICDPLFSDTIRDGTELKICHMTKDIGFCQGGEDVVILCGKIHKGNVKVKFFELDEKDDIVWCEYAYDSEIYHQVAIKFKTPKYMLNIQKKVYVCLEQGNKSSAVVDFTYIPEATCNEELIICHMTRVTGFCQGGEDNVILCEKIDKGDVKIKFFEQDENGAIVWYEYALFNDSDIHHQVAIKFKTPQYKLNIRKKVSVCLEQGNKKSAEVDFTYIPEDSPSKKMRYDGEQTVNLITNPAGISSSSYSSNGIPPDIFKERKELLTSCEEILNGESLSNSFEMYDDLEEPSSALGPDLLQDFQSLDSLVSYLLEDNEDDFTAQHINEAEEVPNELDEQVLDQSYPFSPNPDNVMIDVGKLSGQMAAINLKEIPKKESRDKIFEDKQKKIVKCLPLLYKKDSNGNSLLHLAVLHNKSIRKVFYMNKISESSIINAKNNYKQTALHIAVEKNSDVIPILLENFADPNIQDADGNNSYHISCYHDFAKSLKYMANESYCCELGLNDFNYEGLTPLHVALKNYSPACLDFLLKNCNHLIDFSLVESNDKKSFLHYAVEYSPSYVLPLLKENKIEINAKDSMGNTPLWIAYVKHNHDIVSQLLSAGATMERKAYKFNSSVPVGSSSQPSFGQVALRQAYVKQNFHDSNKDRESARIFEELSKNLSDLLDREKKWEKLATYFVDKKYSNSLAEGTQSPTRCILKYMKKTLGAQYIEQLITALELIGYSDAVIVTTESCQPSTIP